MQKSCLTHLSKVHNQDQDGNQSFELSCSSPFIPFLSLVQGLVGGLEVLVSFWFFIISGL